DNHRDVLDLDHRAAYLTVVENETTASRPRSWCSGSQPVSVDSLVRGQKTARDPVVLLFWCVDEILERSRIAAVLGIRRVTRDGRLIDNEVLNGQAGPRNGWLNDSADQRRDSHVASTVRDLHDGI